MATEVNIDSVKDIYDTFMNSTDGLVRSTLIEEFSNDRIKGAEYASVMLGAIQTAMQLSIEATQKQEADVNESKARVVRDDAKVEADIAETVAKTSRENTKYEDNLLTTAKNREVLDKQKELYDRQRAAFDDNKAQKLLDSQLKAWSITFQDTDTTFIPGQVSQDGTYSKYIGGPTDDPEDATNWEEADCNFGFDQAFEAANRDYTTESYPDIIT